MVGAGGSAGPRRGCRARAVFLLFATGLMLAGGGCVAPRDPVPYARTYPEVLRQSETLDIQVFRGSTRLRLTNTTARRIEAGTLWLNAWYSRPIDALDVGDSLNVRLTEFRDENSEAFRSGGFFATEPPERLVLAQIETEDADGERTLLGLIVVDGRDEEFGARAPR